MIQHATRITFAMLSIIVITATTADATPASRRNGAVVCNHLGCSDRPGPGASAVIDSHTVDANGNSAVVGGRPAGCPRRYCGCEASLYVFGEIRPMLNVARNWRVMFPRTSPAPGMVAARKDHVFVLMSHVEGDRWMVHDGNSGGGLTREHVRSIRGYTVVNPRGARPDSESLSAKASARRN